MAFRRKMQEEPPLRSLPSRRGSSLRRNAQSQLQSLLIQVIPVEIRLIVWDYVLGSDLLHIDHLNGNLASVECSETDLEDKLGFKHVCWRYITFRNGRHTLGEPLTRRLLSLPLSCKLL